MFHIPYIRVISTPPTLYTEDLVTRTDTRSSPSSWRRKKLEERRRRRENDRSTSLTGWMQKNWAEDEDPSRAVKLVKLVSLGIRKSEWLLRLRNSARCGWSISRYLSVNFNPFLNPRISLSQGWIGDAGVPAREAKNRGWKGNFAFRRGDISFGLLSFDTATDGEGVVRSFVRSGSFNDFPKSKLLVYAKDEGNWWIISERTIFRFFSNS